MSVVEDIHSSLEDVGSSSVKSINSGSFSISSTVSLCSF
jgi:hypothetical protein